MWAGAEQRLGCRSKRGEAMGTGCVVRLAGRRLAAGIRLVERPGSSRCSTAAPGRHPGALPAPSRPPRQPNRTHCSGGAAAAAAAGNAPRPASGPPLRALLAAQCAALHARQPAACGGGATGLARAAGPTADVTGRRRFSAGPHGCAPRDGCVPGWQAPAQILRMIAYLQSQATRRASPWAWRLARRGRQRLGRAWLWAAKVDTSGPAAVQGASWQPPAPFCLSTVPNATPALRARAVGMVQQADEPRGLAGCTTHAWAP